MGGVEIQKQSAGAFKDLFDFETKLTYSIEPYRPIESVQRAYRERNKTAATRGIDTGSAQRHCHGNKRSHCEKERQLLGFTKGQMIELLFNSSFLQKIATHVHTVVQQK